MEELNLVTGESLQKALGLSRSTLWRLRRQGLPSRRVGRSIRYPLPEVKAWLNEVAPTLHAPIEAAQKAQMSMFGSVGSVDSVDSVESFDADLNSHGAVDDLLPCHWSAAVALDPKHRPQSPDAPSSTVRKDWRKYPQEAHLLDIAGHRYRRLAEDEIAVIQGFPPDWGKGLGLTHRERIAGLGNAVPPPVGEALYHALEKVMPEPPRTAVEICAGFGGLALGAHSTGRIDILALVEFWEAAVRVLRTSGHWDPRRVHLCDVKTFDWSVLAGQVDVLSGGPPCQPWSVAGHALGAEDERDLLGETPSLVQTLRPRAFIFENVPGLLTPTHRDYLEQLVRRLRSNGEYGVAVGTIQAADFGVPQLRKRIIIAGLRDRSDGAVHDFFDHLHALRTHADPSRAMPRDKQPWVTLGEALPEWREQHIRGWRRWLGEPSEASVVVSDGAAGTSPSDERASPAFNPAPAIGLVWPGRDHAVSWADGHWSVSASVDSMASDVAPLLPSADSNRLSLDPWYLQGDHVRALESLRAAVGRRAKLVYFEPPRLDTDLVSFAAEDVRSRLDTWLTLNQASIRRAISLLHDGGVLAILTGVSEQPYLQVLLDERFGQENRVGTVVWEKGYSVQGQKKDVAKKDIYPTHDYLLIYSRRRKECLERAALMRPPQGFSNDDGDPRGPWKAEQKGANYHRSSSDFSVNLPPYRWALVGDKRPPWLWRISPKSGVIWAPGDEIREAGEWSIRVRVTDSSGAHVDRDYTIRVVDQGAPPAPIAPSWLIARDAEGNPTNDDSPANAPRSDGAVRIGTKLLPEGVIGKPYFACIEAKGGKPYSGTTRPGKTSKSGKSRYWDYSFETLEKAAAEDAVDFKDDDESIPAAKVYLEGAAYTYLNQISTWRGNGKGDKDPTRVGWGQDAKKELEQLFTAGSIKKVINIAKPAGLMSRLLGLFTNEGDLVIDIGSPAAEMAALSCQLRRQTVYVEMPGTDEDGEAIRIPRLKTAARGRHPVPEGVLFTANTGDVPENGYFVGRRPREDQPDGDVCRFRIGAPLLRIDRSTHVARVNYDSYPSGSREFLQALASTEGLVWVPGSDGEFARSHDRQLVAVHFPGGTPLDGRAFEAIKQRYMAFLSEPGTRVRVYYHRGYEDVRSSSDGRLEVRHVPFDLVSAAGTWS